MGREATTSGGARGAAPGATELLRAALEKIVFFEWRLSELSAELASAQTRTAAAEADRKHAHDVARSAALDAQEARRHTVELEAERARLAALLARPSPAQVIDEAALTAERDRAAELAAQLRDAQAELSRQKEERARWLQEMIDQARQGDEAPAALAQFISELRGEVLELRERQRACDALLAGSGIAPPAPVPAERPHSAPIGEHDAVSQARRLWAEGRLGGALAISAEQAAAADAWHRDPSHASDSLSRESSARGDREVSAALPAHDAPALAHEPRAAAPGAGERTLAASPSSTDMLPGLAALKQPKPARIASAPAWPVASLKPSSAAQRALVEQCLRGLTATDPARRAQAARHLASLPLPSAAPGLAAALGRESDPRARAAMARALAACGGDGAAALIAQLQQAHEPPLVRLAALDALFGMAPGHARAALEAAASDPAAALRRRAAALALSAGEHADLLARLSIDPDSAVRAAAGGEGNVPEAPLAEEELHPPAAAPGANPPRAEHAAPTRIEAPRESAGDAAREVVANPQGSRKPAPSAAPAHRDDPLAREALFAVRTAILGLSESDLGSALNLDAARTESLVQQLIAQGTLARRGKRLIVGERGAANPAAERGA